MFVLAYSFSLKVFPADAQVCQYALPQVHHVPAGGCHMPADLQAGMKMVRKQGPGHGQNWRGSLHDWEACSSSTAGACSTTTAGACSTTEHGTAQQQRAGGVAQQGASPASDQPGAASHPAAGTAKCRAAPDRQQRQAQAHQRTALNQAAAATSTLE